MLEINEVVWGHEEVEAFVGAERIIRFHIDELIRVEASLQIRDHYSH